MHAKWARILLRRRVFVLFLILLQLFLMGASVYASSQNHWWVSVLLTLLSVGAMLYVIANTRRSGNKLLWTVIILLFPLFGGLLYLLIRLQTINESFRRNLQKAERDAAPYYKKENPLARLRAAFPDYYHHGRFLVKEGGFRVFSDSKTTYLSPGESFFEALLSALSSAHDFIFLEYFIIADGSLWRSVLEVLKQKAAEGVDVRLIYDDLGCFFRLPADYRETLEKAGIRCVVFNPFRPALSTLQNNRDHRKIAVIDGKIAFTGGINLADEYRGEGSRFGYWKDAAIRIEGPAVDGFTLMFLTLWQALTGARADFGKYVNRAKPITGETGLVIPFCDSPVDEKLVSEQVYMNIIGSARDTLFIQTPYLIIDDIMSAALIAAAKNGVDVRIMTPGIPDKRYAHATTRSYYRELLRGGVKIYEFTPGFIHSKTIVADKKLACIGTINFDCRSLYLHFECAALLFGGETPSVLSADFSKTQAKCRAVTEQDCKVGLLGSVIRSLLRLFAPLL